MLKTFQSIVAKLDIDFYIVGAIARDIRLSVDPAMKASRQTNDVDIVLLVADETQFYQL